MRGETTSWMKGDATAIRPSSRELVLEDPASALRWFEHDYPCPIARWNHHPEFELHHIRAGRGRMLVGDHAGRFEAGHLSLIGSNLPHDWISDLAPGEVIERRDTVLQFGGERLRGAVAFFPELDELDTLLRDAGRGIAYSGGTAARGVALLLDMGRARGLERLELLFAILRTLAQAPADERTLLASPIFAMSDDPRFDAAVRHLLDNVYRELGIAEVAALAGLSETSFSRRFKRMAGRNFVDFVRAMRIAQACRLLRQTSSPVSSICYDVGFGNLSNFNRQFRAETGVSPSDYRARGAARATHH